MSILDIDGPYNRTTVQNKVRMSKPTWTKDDVKVENVIFGGTVVTTMSNDQGDKIVVRTPDSLIPGRNDEVLGDKIARGDYQFVKDDK